jgi:chromate reductase
MELLAISGSLRKLSYNTALLKAAIELAPENVKISLFPAIGEMPLFNPDINENDFHDSVINFREAVAKSDAIIISTPEYAHGIPGALKNAFDWVVSSSEIILKPIAIMSVSTSELGGFRAHESLVKVLHAMNTNIIIDAALNVPFAKTKFNDKGELVDATTKQALAVALSKVVQVAEQRKTESAG